MDTPLLLSLTRQSVILRVPITVRECSKTEPSQADFHLHIPLLTSCTPTDRLLEILYTLHTKPVYHLHRSISISTYYYTYHYSRWACRWVWAWANVDWYSMIPDLPVLSLAILGAPRFKRMEWLLRLGNQGASTLRSTASL